jgi:hypothetical protein
MSAIIMPAPSEPLSFGSLTRPAFGGRIKNSDGDQILIGKESVVKGFFGPEAVPGAGQLPIGIRFFEGTCPNIFEFDS